jgi:hypothetical protein
LLNNIASEHDMLSSLCLKSFNASNRTGSSLCNAWDMLQLVQDFETGY